MKPFNLEAAKSGAPIVTRDGREARFIAHVPEVTYESCRLLALIDGAIYHYWSTGEMDKNRENSVDLFMKPQKRTVWVNLNKASGKFYVHETEESAKRGAECIAGGVSSHLLAAAVPIEIEE